MKQSEKKALEETALILLTKCIVLKNAKEALAHEANGVTLFEAVVGDVVATPNWQNEHRFSDDDVRHAIVKEIRVRPDLFKTH